MIGRKRWRCSFCRRDEARVARLVAGPRLLLLGPHVSICDDCVARTQRIMDEATGPQPGPAPAPGPLKRLFRWRFAPAG